MSEKTPFRCPEFSCRKKFTSHSWRPKHIKLQDPEPLQVTYRKNLSIRRPPRHIQPAQLHELNVNKDSDDELDMFPSLKHVEIITDSESQPPPSLQRMKIYKGTRAWQINLIAEPWEREAQGCLETNLQLNP
jgi:hypothetical protein